jgi:predicted DNA-binding transcriptional regulator YafY
MTELTETVHSFKMNPTFDAESYFQDYFGVIPDQTIKAEHIVLRAYSPMDNYLRTLPLHHSQKEIVTEKQSAIFEYYVAPTHDFIQAILKEGHELEVIEPESLRKTIHDELTKAIERYK